MQTGGFNNYKYFLIGMTKKEKIFIATREKEKGNEAFASGDYVEAVTYYARWVNSVFLYFNNFYLWVLFWKP